MGRELDKVRDRKGDAIAAIEETGKRDLTTTTPFANASGFFSFRYSSTEIFSQGGDLHVKMRETRLQGGRFLSEECEGTLDRQACERIANEAHGYVLNQVANFARLLYAPFGWGGRRDE